MYILEYSYGCPSDKYPENGIFQFDQAKALADYGHKVVYAAVDLRSIRKKRKPGCCIRERMGIPVYEYNVPIGPILPKISSRISKYGFSKLLKRIIRDFGKPDIIHAHFGYAADAVIESCRKYNIPLVITEHSSSVNRDDLSQNERESLAKIYESANAVVAVSSTLATRIKAHTGVKAEVVPNIVDLNVFKMTSQCIESNKPFVFLSAGNLIERKGFDILLRAYSLVNDNIPNSRLVIMGDGPEKQRLFNLAIELKVQGKVLFSGAFKREDFATTLLDSDVFILATKLETFGVVYIEAMACGIPVIATRCGGPEDFVTAENGVLVDVDDIDALSEAMVRMYNHIAGYNKEEISKFAFDKFSANSIAKQLTEIMKKVV